MAIERSWESVGPIAFTANGGADGTVTLLSAAGFKVKQSVVVSATSLPDLKLEVKKVISPTKLIVGPVVTTGKLLARQDLSAYTLVLNANLRAEEQKKAVLPMADIIQAVYRQEPGTTIGVELDDQFGQPFDLNNPIPVSASPLWDEIDLAYDANQNLETVEYKKNGQTVTLNLEYDANQNLSKVTKS